MIPEHVSRVGPETGPVWSVTQNRSLFFTKIIFHLKDVALPFAYLSAQ
jgi:hypothetical protein